MGRTATLTAAEAVERLRAAGMKINPATLRAALLAGAFPFGTAVVANKEVVCWVFPRKLEEWIKENLAPEEAPREEPKPHGIPGGR